MRFRILPFFGWAGTEDLREVFDVATIGIRAGSDDSKRLPLGGFVRFAVVYNKV